MKMKKRQSTQYIGLKLRKNPSKGKTQIRIFLQRYFQYPNTKANKPFKPQAKPQQDLPQVNFQNFDITSLMLQL